MRKPGKTTLYSAMFSLLTVAFMLILSAAAVSATDYGYADSAYVKLSLLNQDPDPVQPGDYVDVRISVENLGTEPASSIVLVADESYPFSFDPGYNRTRAISKLGKLQKDDNSRIIKFKLRVDNNAVEGDSTFKVRYKYGNKGWQDAEFNISIRTIDALLAVESIKTLPEQLVQGKKAKVNVILKSLDDSVLKDVSVKLDLALTTLSTGTSLTSLPFAPVGSATEKKAQLIGPGKELIFSYDIIVYPDAASGVYKVPVQVHYYDILGNEYTKQDFIGIIVGDKPKLSVSVDNPEDIAEGSISEASIKFVNHGITDIKYLNVRLKPGSSYKIISSPVAYVGNIDSDDYSTAEFKLFVKRNASRLLLPLEISYADANNRQYNRTLSLSVDILNANEKELYGLSEKSSKTWVLLVLAAAVAGFFLIRRIRKRKQDD